jgi:hypothetical protein
MMGADIYIKICSKVQANNYTNIMSLVSEAMGKHSHDASYLKAA